jgi:hypothetical protein
MSRPEAHTPNSKHKSSQVHTITDDGRQPGITKNFQAVFQFAFLLTFFTHRRVLQLSLGHPRSIADFKRLSVELTKETENRECA